MAPPTSEQQLQRAEEWKQKGNIAFRAKNFSEALSCYTEAISLDSNSQTLFSNRSAAYLSLGRLQAALKDAESTIALDPKWAKGYRRKAGVLDAMKRFREALSVYEAALAAARADAKLSDEQKRREEGEVRKLMIALNKKLNAKPAYPDVLPRLGTPGTMIVREAERRMQGGEQFGAWPLVGSCCRRLWIAEMQFHNASLHLHEFMASAVDSGQQVITGRLQTLEELTTALIEDVRVARLDPAALEKLELCLRLEQQRRNAIGPGMSPAEMVGEYKRRLKEPPEARRVLATPLMTAGWDYVRPALQLSIRSSLLNGFLKSIFDAEQTGSIEFHRCVELIEAARTEWADVDGGIRGRTLEETFLRQVKVHLGESLMVEYLRDPGEAKKKLLDEIFAIGDWIVSSFQSKPHPPEEERFGTPAGEPGWWTVYYAHYAAPLSKAYTFIAFANLRYGIDIETIPLDSPTTRKKGPIACDPKRLGVAAINYAKAAAWMPVDEPYRANALWYAIFAMVRRGGYYLADFEILRDMASKCPSFFSPFFPPETISENHAGKLAAAEVLGTSVGGVRDMICSPMVLWPDGVDTDMDTLQEVMGPWTGEIVNGVDGGLLALTEVMRNTWRERVQKWGENKETVGGEEVVWADVEESLRMNWEVVWRENQEEGNKVFEG